MTRKWSLVFFIAGAGFLSRGVAGDILLSPFIAVGTTLLVLGVVSLFRAPKPKKTDYERVLDDIHSNRPIKL